MATEHANKEQAERCAELAVAAQREGNLVGAIRLFDKSLRMYDNAAVRRARDRAAALLQADATHGAGATPTTSAASHAPTPAASTPPPASATAAAPSASGSGRASSSGGKGSRRTSPTGGGSGGSGARVRAGGGAGGATSSGGGSATHHAPPQRPFTPEQAEAVAAVKRAKDYYEVLGVPRDADGETVKRAYRKLAMRMHPDKNPAPGSEDAFKRIGAAFAILSDPDKKANYDRYGETEGAAGGGEDVGNGRAAARARYYQQYEQEISPEDIFNMFFGFPGAATAVYGTDGHVYMSHGGGFRQAGGQRVRMRHVRPGGGGGEGDAMGHRMMQLVQLLPILVLILFTLFSFTSISPEERLFSLSQEGGYTVERRTMSHNIVPNLPYYVKEEFARKTSADRYLLTRVERQVETELYTTLSRRCSDESQSKRALETKIRYAAGERKEQLQRNLKAMVTPACDAFQKYFAQYVTHAGF